MIEREIMIEGKPAKARSSALIPKLYRAYFGRDMVQDMRQLAKGYNKLHSLPEDATEEEREEAQLSMMDLEIFEKVAWIMLKHGGEDVGETPEEWLDSLDGIFSVYEAMPTILELWTANNKTTSVPRKK